MRLLTSLFAVFLLLATPALAVDVTFTVGPKTFSTTITAGNAARFNAWALAAYPTIPNPAFDPDCPPDPGPCAPATLPNPEPGISALRAVFDGIKANVLSYEREKAKAEVAEPAPIN